MLWTNKSGIINKIEGIEKFKNIDGFEIDFQKKVGDEISAYHSIGNILFTASDIEEMCRNINFINNTIHVYNEKGEDVIIKYTNFDYLRKVYYEGLNGE